MTSRSIALVPAEHITHSTLVLRGERVILDSDLAAVYGVTTKRLNEQVRRNRGGRRYLPSAFTEHGAIMAATVLNSPRAVEMSIYVVRAFVKLRELLASNHELAHRLDELERRIEKKLATHDQAITATLSAIRQLMSAPAPKRRPRAGAADGGARDGVREVRRGIFTRAARPALQQLVY